VATFVAAEIVVITSMMMAKAPSFEILLNVLVTSVPVVAGVRGHGVVRRLLSLPHDDDSIIWLGRQFLVVAIFAYCAIIMNLTLLTKALHMR